MCKGKGQLFNPLQLEIAAIRMKRERKAGVEGWPWAGSLTAEQFSTGI